MQHHMLEPLPQAPDAVHPKSRPRGRWTVGLPEAITLFALMALGLALHGFSGDGLMDINIGQWILAHGHVPLHNHFTTAMAGQPFSDTEWAYAVYAALAYDIGGRMGFYGSLLPFLAVTAFFGGRWIAQWPTRWGWMVAPLAGLGLMITSNPRPQLLSYAAFAYALWAVGQARERQWWPLAGLLPVVILWTNWHSSVVLVPALLANETLWSGPSRRYRLQMAGAAVASAFVMGVARIGGAADQGTFLAHVFSSGVLNVIAEWQSPNFHTAIGVAIWPALFVAWAIFLPRAWRQRQWAVAVWLLAGPIATLWAIRFAPYMILGELAAMARLWPALSDSAERREDSHPIRVDPSRFLWAGVALLLWGGAMLSTTNRFIPRYPVQAMQYLKAHHARHVVVFQSWSDAAEFSGLDPWSNGQAQMWAQTSWWLPFVQAQTGGQLIVPWIQRWDPSAQWILWPIAGYEKIPGAIHAAGWQLVDRTTTREGVVGVWHRTPGGGP